MDLDEIKKKILAAISIIDEIPEDLYPLLDPYLSDAYNSLDDALYTVVLLE